MVEFRQGCSYPAGIGQSLDELPKRTIARTHYRIRFASNNLITGPIQPLSSHFGQANWTRQQIN